MFDVRTVDIVNVNVLFRKFEFSILATPFILRWQTMGTTVAGFGSPPSAGLDRLYTPYSITIDSFDALYVADYTNDRVQKFSAGSLIGTTVAGQTNGAPGSSASDLHFPTGVLVDSSGNIYVSDSFNHRVQLFPNGSSLGITVAGNGKEIRQEKE